MANKITKDTLCGTTELASVLGITGRRVQQLVQDGVIIAVKKGRYNLSDAVGKYIDFITDDEKDSEETTLEKQKLNEDIKIKKSKARIEKMKADEMSGRMHRSEDVAEMTEALVYTIRGMLVSLPGRLAIDLEGCEGTAQRADVIQKEIFEVMRELAKWKYDPKDYEEKVRERLNWSTDTDADEGY